MRGARLLLLVHLGLICCQSPSSKSESWSESVRRVHRQADLGGGSDQKHKLAQEMADLAAFSRAPHSKQHLLLKQDLAARSARLFLETHDIPKAKSTIERALAHGKTATVGRAQLLMLLADCEKAQGDNDAERRALLEALSIHRELFSKELQSQ